MEAISLSKTPFMFAGSSVLAGAQEAQEEGARKKRKAVAGNPLPAQAVEIGHHSELTGHTDAVTSVIWHEPEVLHSGSMDHSVSAALARC